MRNYALLIVLCIQFSLFAHPLKVVYMAQAGYDPRDVERRGREFTDTTGIDVTFQFEEYEDIYGLVTGPAGQNGDFDVVLLDNIWTADFVDRGILDPVPEDFRHRIESGMIPAIYSANMYHNKMWGVPFLANFQLLYTNMDLLKKAGYDHPPRTLGEMREMSAAAKSRGIIEYPIFDSLREEEILVCELVWLSGAYGNDWNTDENSLMLDRRENRQAIQYLVDLKKEGLLNPYSLESGEMFSAEVFTWGDALFTTNWTFLIGRLEEARSQSGKGPRFNYAVSVLPVARRGMQSATVSGFQGLAVMKTSDRKDDAWRFIAYLSSPQFQRRYLDEFPVWKEVWSEPATMVRDPLFSVKKAQVEGAKVRPAHPEYQDLSNIIQHWVYEALQERVSVETAFHNIQREIRELGL